MDKHDYVIHHESDFYNTAGYTEAYYHPAVLLQKKNHRVVASRFRKGTTKPVTIKCRPPSIHGNDWYFLAQLANEALVTIQGALFDSEDPFLKYGEVKCPINVYEAAASHIWAVLPQGLQPNACYWWLWDTGTANGIYIGQAQPADYSVALEKGKPYWQSLWGHWGQSNVWLWFPTSGFQTPGSRRAWGKLLPELLNEIIEAGPFVEKTQDSVLSVNCKYTFKFQFGGPSITSGQNAGTNPKDIPPGYQPRAEQLGVQVDDLAEHAQGVLMPWDIRRGILTSRGTTRLTKEPFSTDLQQKFEQERTGQWPSEEETSSSEEEEEEDSEDEQQQLDRQLELIRQLRLAGEGMI